MLLNSILDNSKLEDFDNILENLDNNYLALYQSSGQDDLLLKTLKDKFTKKLFCLSVQCPSLGLMNKGST